MVKTKKKKELPKCDFCGKTIQLDDDPEFSFSLDDKILPSICTECLDKLEDFMWEFHPEHVADWTPDQQLALMKKEKKWK